MPQDVLTQRLEVEAPGYRGWQGPLPGWRWGQSPHRQEGAHRRHSHGVPRMPWGPSLCLERDCDKGSPRRDRAAGWGSSAAGGGGFASWVQGPTTAPLQTLWRDCQASSPSSFNRQARYTTPEVASRCGFLLSLEPRAPGLPPS